MAHIPTIVQIGDREFDVCKSILISSSPEFREMFAQVDTRDQSEIRIEIFGLDADVFEAMHEYLFQGKAVEQVYAVADRLVIAADKYQIGSLKDICEQYLCTQINSANVCNYLLIADTATAANLKSACVQYIKSNRASVLQTPQWTQLISGDNNTKLVAELNQMLFPNPTGITPVQTQPNIFEQLWQFQFPDWLIGFLKILGIIALGLIALAAIVFFLYYVVVVICFLATVYICFKCLCYGIQGQSGYTSIV